MYVDPAGVLEEQSPSILSSPPSLLVFPQPAKPSCVLGVAAKAYHARTRWIAAQAWAMLRP